MQLLLLLWNDKQAPRAIHQFCVPTEVDEIGFAGLLTVRKLVLGGIGWAMIPEGTVLPQVLKLFMSRRHARTISPSDLVTSRHFPSESLRSYLTTWFVAGNSARTAAMIKTEQSAKTKDATGRVFIASNI